MRSLLFSFIVKNPIRSTGDPSSKKMKILVQPGLQASKKISVTGDEILPFLQMSSPEKGCQ